LFINLNVASDATRALMHSQRVPRRHLSATLQLKWGQGIFERQKILRRRKYIFFTRTKT